MDRVIILVIGSVIFGFMGWDSGKRIRKDGFNFKTIEHLVTSLLLLLGALAVSIITFNTWGDLLEGDEYKNDPNSWFQVSKANLMFSISYVILYLGSGIAAWKLKK